MTILYRTAAGESSTTARELAQRYATAICHRYGWDVNSPAWRDIVNAHSTEREFLIKRVQEEQPGAVVWFEGEEAPKKDAVARAQEMMLVPMGQLPPLAVDFAKHITRQVGMCGEVMLTCYAVYAQCVEGLPCADDLYQARPKDVQWFKERITRTLGVAGGEACVAGTRIAVWTLEGFRRQGVSDDELLQQYPDISPAALQAARVYAEKHPEEIESALRNNQEPHAV